MTAEIRNPAKLPTDLYPAEDKFVHDLMAGEPCTIEDGELPKKAIKFGEGANVVRSKVIRFFAFGGNKELDSVIRLQGAWIAESLDLTDAPIPYALTFSNCHFDASVTMGDAEYTELSLNGSRLAQGLFVDNLTTKGDVNLSEGFFAEGIVQLVNTTIGGNLNCADGKFCNLSGYALFSHKLKVEGGVNLSKGFSAEGGVSLRDASIGGDLDCAGGEFHHPNGYALDIDGGNIGGRLYWRTTTCTGNVNLTCAKVDMFLDDSDSWKSCKVNLDGFIYSQFVDPVGTHPVDVQFRIGWLSKRPDEIPFSHQPYEQAAKAYFKMGRASDARRILLEKERESTMHGQRRHRLLRWLWGICAGYGYGLWRTAFWSLTFILIGTGVFWYADRHHRIVPAQVIVQADSYYEHVVKSHGVRPTDIVPKLFPGYVEFTPLAYSLDVFIPFFILQQESTWLPDSGGPDNVLKPSIMLLLAFFALVIFAFLGRIDTTPMREIVREMVRTCLPSCLRLCGGAGSAGGNCCNLLLR